MQAFYYIFWLFTYPVSKIGRNIYITNTEQDVKGLIDIAQNEGVLRNQWKHNGSKCFRFR
nr:hypothetical protein [Mycoplasmopsis bovis]